MAYGEGADPRNATLVTAQTVAGVGLLLKHNGSDLWQVTGSADSSVALGVSADESNRDAAGDLQTAAGATVSYYPMGGVLMVASEALTWVTGDLAYASGTGLCDKTSSSQKAIGVYVGEGETAAAGALIAINTNSAVVA